MAEGSVVPNFKTISKYIVNDSYILSYIICIYIYILCTYYMDYILYCIHISASKINKRVGSDT